MATHDETADWVRNLRAAGDGTVGLGRRQWQFTATELPQQQAGKVIERVLAPRMRQPVAGFVLRQTLAVAPDAPTADFVAAAARRPVFELTIMSGPEGTDPAQRPGADSIVTTLAQRLPAALILLGLTVATVHLSLGLAHVVDGVGWVSGVAIGLLLAGASNHLRIFGSRRTPTDHPATLTRTPESQAMRRQGRHGRLMRVSGNPATQPSPNRTTEVGGRPGPPWDGSKPPASTSPPC